MNTKTVYSFDPVSHQYLRAITLDESDMSPLEVGVWLVPGNCLEAAPPIANAGQYMVALNGAWAARDIPKPPPPIGALPVDAEPVAPVDSLERRSAALRMGVQDNMDASARAYGYDDIRNAVSYADEESVPKFWAQGRMFRAWRSLTWDCCYSLLAAVGAGELAEPATLADLLPMLPLLDTVKCDADEAALTARKAAEVAAVAAEVLRLADEAAAAVVSVAEVSAATESAAVAGADAAPESTTASKAA